MSTRLILFVMALGGSMTAFGEAMARPHVWDFPQIRDGAYAAALAVEISEKCPELSVRKVSGISFLMGLKSDAKKQGLSDAEIKADLKEMEPKAYELLYAKGAVKGQPETYCAVGRAEISANSQIGKLLK